MTESDLIEWRAFFKTQGFDLTDEEIKAKLNWLVNAQRGLTDKNEWYLTNDTVTN